MKPNYEAVVVDSCVPRNEWERVATVASFAEDFLTAAELSPSNDDLLILSGLIREADSGNPFMDAHEAEERAIQVINDYLPAPWICTCGEFQPGDVIIHEWED